MTESNKSKKNIRHCPAIKVKDFHYTNNYALIIKCSPNAYQIITDKPILYNNIDLTPKINLNGEDATKNVGGINIQDTIDKYNKLLTDVKSSIDEKLKPIFDIINNPTKQPSDCPENVKKILKEKEEENKKPEEVNITNSNDDVVETISISQVDGKIKKCEVDETVKLVELFTLPENFDPLEYENKSPDVQICNFPESKLKNQVNYIVNELPDDLNKKIDDLNKTAMPGSFNNVLSKFNNGKSINSDEDLKSFYKQFEEDDKFNKITKKKSYLGIPIATLEEKTPVILQILNKKPQVMNLFDGKTGAQLEIDKEIDMYKNFTIIFKTNGFLHQLHLIIEDDPKIYSAEVFTPKNLTICYIGIDPEVTKSYCGLIIDIQILTYQKNSVQTYLSKNINFKTPVGCLAFYDWHKERIKYNLVFPLPDLKYPVKMYGNSMTHYHIDKTKDPYHFMSRTYLSEFFCSRMLNQDEWSLWYWFYIDPKMPYNNNTGFDDFRTIVYDHKNQNKLSFDFNSMLFKFEFGDKHVNKQYILDTNVWYQNILKYSKKEKKIILRIRRIDIKNLSLTTEFEVPVNDLKFDLFSMLASFDGWKYDSYFVCKFGTLAIFNKFTTKSEEDDHFFSSRIVINQLGL